MAKQPVNLSNRVSRQVTNFDVTDAPRILIVENDAYYALQLIKWLNDWQMPLFKGNCKVDIAENIQKATEYLDKGTIDIFIIDLIMGESEHSVVESEDVGKAFVQKVIEKTNAGIIVYSSLAATNEAAPLITAGADDYIQKHSDQETMRARVLGLWRRMQLIPQKKQSALLHTNRVFLIGHWRFTVGNRTLSDEAGQSVRLSSTEHAFLRHICTVEDHECSIEDFNLEVLGRRNFERNMRVDNLIYRLRKKLGDQIQLISDDGAYRLVDVSEVKRQTTAA